MFPVLVSAYSHVRVTQKDILIYFILFLAVNSMHI